MYNFNILQNAGTVSAEDAKFKSTFNQEAIEAIGAFAKDWHMNTAVQMGFFQSPTIIKDRGESHGDLISQVEEIYEFVKKHINCQVVISDKFALPNNRRNLRRNTGNRVESRQQRYR